MKGYFDNLRPFEKRVVFGVAALMFVVLNFWFVIPHFSDWGRTQIRMAEAREKLAAYQEEIAKRSTYETGIKALEKEGLPVPPEEQNSDFARTVQSQATQSGLQIQQTSKINTRTNGIFLELTETLAIQSGEQQLVDFLHSLGSGNSLIRVRGLTLRPDAPRQQLVVSATVVASYQKKPPAKPASTAAQPGGKAPAAGRKATASAKPEATPAKTAVSMKK